MEKDYTAGPCLFPNLNKQVFGRVPLYLNIQVHVCSNHTGQLPDSGSSIDPILETADSASLCTAACQLCTLAHLGSKTKGSGGMTRQEVNTVSNLSRAP